MQRLLLPRTEVTEGLWLRSQLPAVLLKDVL
jgi:hypothetical protein